jgi:hypothetical protein
MADPSILAVARSLDDVREAVRLRCAQLGITRNELDERAGLTEGHAGKLLSLRGVKHLGRVSLGRVMAATDLVLIVAVDGEPVEQIEQAIADRHIASISQANNKAPHWRSGKGSTWGRRMAARRALKLTAEQRSEIARKAAQARWKAQRLGP